MKGVALPIEVLVIVVIAVIVLLGLIAVYFAGWTPFSGTIGIDAVKNAGCRILVYNNTCAGSPSSITFDGTIGGLPMFDVDADGDYDSNDNLATLCSTYYDADATQCKRLCGCP